MDVEINKIYLLKVFKYRVKVVKMLNTDICQCAVGREAKTVHTLICVKKENLIEYKKEHKKYLANFIIDN